MPSRTIKVVTCHAPLGKGIADCVWEAVTTELAKHGITAVHFTPPSAEDSDLVIMAKVEVPDPPSKKRVTRRGR